MIIKDLRRTRLRPLSQVALPMSCFSLQCSITDRRWTQPIADQHCWSIAVGSSTLLSTHCIGKIKYFSVHRETTVALNFHNNHYVLNWLLQAQIIIRVGANTARFRAYFCQGAPDSSTERSAPPHFYGQQPTEPGDRVQVRGTLLL